MGNEEYNDNMITTDNILMNIVSYLLVKKYSNIYWKERNIY